MPAHRRLLYGHRGACAELPENTMASFERALERGATAIETDCHLTRDGFVVLAHDPSGARTAGVAAEIRASTLAEVRGWDVGWGFVGKDGDRPFAGKGFRMPTLDAALAAFPDVAFNVDVKQRSPSLFEPVLEVLRRRHAEERVRIASFDLRTTRGFRRRGFTGSVGLGMVEVGMLITLPERALASILRPGDAAQLPLRAFGVEFANRRTVERCHSLGLRVDFWTVNDAATATRLLALGADGIMSDDPAAVASAVG